MENLDETELLQKAKQHDEGAMLELIEKYRSCVKSISRQYFLSGGDENDIIQEGMIGLYKAILSYDFKSSTNFKTFASMCIRRQIQTAIKSANRQKNKPLNDYISIAVTSVDEDEQIGLVIPSQNSDPEQKLISREQSAEEQSRMQKVLENKLSGFEKDVLVNYLKGLSYAEIADNVKKDVKSVDNALLRIKKKLLGAK